MKSANGIDAINIQGYYTEAAQIVNNCGPIVQVLGVSGGTGAYMGGILDLRPLVVAAAMADEHLHAIDDAHLVRIGEHGEQALHLGVRDGRSAVEEFASSIIEEGS